MIRVLLALATLLCLVPVANAASFDCAKASTSFERAICGSPELSERDEVLAQAYATALGGLSKAAADRVKSDQHDWRGYAERACSDDAQPIAGDYTDDQVQCLNAVFMTRIKGLEASRMLGGYRFYPVTRSRLEPDPDADTNAYNKLADKQYESVRIDRDTDVAAAFNAMADGIRDDYPDFFVKGGDTIAAGDATEDVTVTVSVKDVAASRIALQVDDYSYGHGAAHGNYAITYRHFLIAQQRPLETSDVFSGEDWRATLGKLVLDKLQATIEDGVWPESVKDIPDWAADPKRWDFSDDGLIVQFEPYEVTAYAMGAPTVTISWDDLDSILADGARDLSY